MSATAIVGLARWSSIASLVDRLDTHLAKSCSKALDPGRQCCSAMSALWAADQLVRRRGKNLTWDDAASHATVNP